VEELTANGLVRRFAVDDEEGGNGGPAYCYGVTPRGLEFLDTYWKMKGFLEVFGEDEA